jgi:hypothetical protein
LCLSSCLTASVYLSVFATRLGAVILYISSTTNVAFVTAVAGWDCSRSMAALA